MLAYACSSDSRTKCYSQVSDWYLLSFLFNQSVSLAKGDNFKVMKLSNWQRWGDQPLYQQPQLPSPSREVAPCQVGALPATAEYSQIELCGISDHESVNSVLDADSMGLTWRWRTRRRNESRRTSHVSDCIAAYLQLLRWHLCELKWRLHFCFWEERGLVEMTLLVWLLAIHNFIYIYIYTLIYSL